MADVVQRLAEYKDALEKVDEQGNTVLHVAASLGHESICQELVISGAKKTVKNQAGEKALDRLPEHAGLALRELLEGEDEDEEDDGQSISSKGGEGGEGEEGGNPQQPIAHPYLNTIAGATKRRSGVSAEILSAVNLLDYEPKVIPKTEEEAENIKSMVSQNLLFRFLDEEQKTAIFDAMEKRTFADGDVLIKQGDEGDFFYLLDTGVCDIFVKSKDNPEPIKVLTCKHGDSFGELALMYDTPRAATVVAVGDVTCWAMDRMSYKHILLATTQKRRDQYKEFLDKVELLQSLDNYERYSLADALTSETFKEGDVIMHQGDGKDASNSEYFYIIESGKVVCTKKEQEDGEEEVVGELGAGAYFGELALLTNQPRACTVTAAEDLTCLRLERTTFERIMGPLKKIMERHITNYEKYDAGSAIKLL
eukprot:TRINITY_DN1487_c0_g2_i3.p1 TRINITY_DN1487_c0_g2~~TRINITY_DN1487_c0_g2_i3.p1  ORF type:complete len:423 (-),score=163.29 TRINITY_DN1487_c0_g2_i3:87-1355(-)